MESKNDKLNLLKSIIPERFRPCEINLENKVIQGIFLSVKKGSNFSGLKAVVLIKKGTKTFDEEVPLNIVNRISWDDYIFPTPDKITKQFQIYVRSGEYFLLLDSSKSKIFESYKPERYALLFSLKTARKDDSLQEFLTIPITEFEKDFEKMSNSDDPNDPSIKDFMFSEREFDINILL